MTIAVQDQDRIAMSLSVSVMSLPFYEAVVSGDRTVTEAARLLKKSVRQVTEVEERWSEGPRRRASALVHGLR